MAANRATPKRIFLVILIVFIAGFFIGRFQARKMREKAHEISRQEDTSPAASMNQIIVTPSPSFLSPQPSPSVSISATPLENTNKEAVIRARIEHAREVLPTREKVSRFSAEALHRHDHLIPFADASGEVVAELEKHHPLPPEILAAGLEFFRECGQNERALTAVRELCIHNWLHWNPRATQEADRTFDPELLKHAREGMPEGN